MAKLLVGLILFSVVSGGFISSNAIEELETADQKQRTLSPDIAKILQRLSDNDLTLKTLKITRLNLGEAEELAEALKFNSTLVRLDLSEAFKKISDDHIRAEKEKSGKIGVRLTESAQRKARWGGTEIGNRIAELFANVLKFNSHLRKLNLDRNRIGAKGAIAIAKALQSNTVLTRLELAINDIQDPGANEFAELLRHQPRLTKLSLVGNNLTSLSVINLANALKGNRCLKLLNLNSASVDNKSAEALAEALQKNSTLITLYLEGPPFWWRTSNIGIQGADALIKALKINTTLRDFKIKSRYLPQETISRMMQLIRRNQALKGMIDNNPNLKSLDLSVCCLDFWDTELIAKALISNSCLKELNLWGNEITDKGALAIGKALKINTALAYLNLNYNNIGMKGGFSIAEALKINSTLVHLDLRLNQLGDIGTTFICEALMNNRGLKELSLSYNQIGFHGAKAVSEVLKENSFLTHIYLGYNQIDDEGAKALVQGLESNSTLDDLYLGGNYNITNSLLKQIEALLPRPQKSNKNKLLNLNSFQMLINSFSFKEPLFFPQVEALSQYFTNLILTMKPPIHELTDAMKTLKIVAPEETANNNVTPKPLENLKGVTAALHVITSSAGPKPSIENKTSSNNNNQKEEELKHFTLKYLVPLYIAGKVPETYKDDPIYKLLIQQYQTAEENGDDKIINFVKATILIECKKPSLFEHLLVTYFRLNNM